MIFKIQLKISRLFICGDTELKAIDDFDLNEFALRWSHVIVDWFYATLWHDERARYKKAKRLFQARSACPLRFLGKHVTIALSWRQPIWTRADWSRLMACMWTIEHVSVCVAYNSNWHTRNGRSYLYIVAIILDCVWPAFLYQSYGFSTTPEPSIMLLGRYSLF